MIGQTKAPPLPSVVAEGEVLLGGRRDRRVRVRFWAPEVDKSTPHRDWMCCFDLTDGAGISHSGVGHGVDSLQPLMLAIEQARRWLNLIGGLHRWIGGRSRDGGLPRFLPLDLDVPSMDALVKKVVCDRDPG